MNSNSLLQEFTFINIWCYGPAVWCLPWIPMSFDIFYHFELTLPCQTVWCQNEQRALWLSPYVTPLENMSSCLNCRLRTHMKMGGGVCMTTAGAYEFTLHRLLAYHPPLEIIGHIWSGTLKPYMELGVQQVFSSPSSALRGSYDPDLKLKCGIRFIGMQDVWKFGQLLWFNKLQWDGSWSQKYFVPLG